MNRALAHAAGVAAAAVCLTGPVSAQSFTRIVAFGDSYVDTGNLWTFLLPDTQLPLYPTGRFSGGSNYIDTLTGLLGAPQSNFAIGGARAGLTNTVATGLPGFAQQWMAFVGGGGRIAPTDLLALNIGGNDARAYYQGGGTLAGAPAAAAVNAAQAMAGVNALVGAGARTLAFTVGDVGALPEAAAFPATATIGTAFNQSYNAFMQAQLAGLAAGGVRIEYVDMGLVGQSIRANPALYGLTSSGACPVACIGDPARQAGYLFYVDRVHLTSRGFEIMGQYVANRLKAPLTFGAQGDLGITAARAFSGDMMSRLDLFNAQSHVGSALAYAERRIAKGPFVEPAPPPRSPLSAYIQINGGLGERSASRAANGYEWNSVGGQIGLDYRIGATGLIGVAFNYANPTARFYDGAGRVDLNAYQLGVYGAWAGPNLFAQATVSAGFLKYGAMRPGVVGGVFSAPSGWTFSAAAKGGYLFDLSPHWRMGPVVGLTYANATVNGATESGDPALTLALRRHSADALIGSAGAQTRYAFALGALPIKTVLNLTAEQDLIGSGRIVRYGATSAPLIVNTWETQKASRSVYGRVGFGASAPLASGVAMTINLSQTFGRRGGDDFTGAGGLKIAF